MFTAGAVGSSSVAKSRYHASLSSGESKYIGQLIESVIEDKPKALNKVLKKKSLDVNLLCRFEDHIEKMTPLHYSALKGKFQIAHTLLMSKLCSIDLQTPFDEATALHFACRFRDSQTAYNIVKELLLNGADVNITDHWDKTALIWASEMGHLDVVKSLLSDNASYDHCCKIEDPPEYAEWPLRFSSPIVEYLHKDPYYGNNALIQACRFSHFEVVKELITSGCDINSKNMNQSTALHAAAGAYCEYPNAIPQTADADIVLYLINCGVGLNALDQFGFTPLARVLLAMSEICGMNISLADKVTPLLKCIQKAHLLIKAGCNVTENYSFSTSSKTSILSQMLCGGKNIVACKSQLLNERFCKTIEMLSLAGCPFTSYDVQLAAGLKLPTLTATVLSNYENPLSLRNMCLICVRNNTRLPLEYHVVELDLPGMLQKQLCLE